MCVRNVTPHLKHQPEHTMPSVKHGGGSTMLWGGFSSTGTVKLLTFNGKMDKAKYKAILEKNC